MRLLLKSLLFIVALFLITACQGNKYDINTEDISINLSYHHTDSILCIKNERTLLQHKAEMKATDPDAEGYLFGYCYGIRLQPDTAFLSGMGKYQSYPYALRLEQRIQDKFQKRLPLLRNDVTKGLKRFRFHFKKTKLPEHIFWVNTGFASSVFCSKKSIVVGLDRYLGANTDVIKELPGNQFYSWIKEGMEPQYMQRDMLLGWANTHLVEETKENFASEMVRWGKLLFVVYACLPEEQEATILRYTQKDYAWALASEWAIWKYLVDEQLLYNTGEDAKQSLLREGPFTRGLPQESPDRMGQFLGYRMVKQYMDDNDVTLEQLISTPYLKILQAYEAPEKK